MFVACLCSWPECVEKEGEIEKNNHPSLRSKPQEVSVMFPGINSACLFFFFLKVPQSGDSAAIGRGQLKACLSE